MKYLPAKLPKQLSLPFMEEGKAEKRVRLSSQEHSELIQALADLIMACASTEDPHTIMEAQDEY